jgi:hypothetical protein
MAFQDVPHGLVTESVPEIGQGADNAIIPPGTILLRHTHHQRFYFLADRGASRTLALLGAVKFLRDKFAVPAKDGVRLDDLGHFRERLLAQLLADLGQGLTLAVTQPYTSLELIAKNAIFGHQILVAQQQFLIDCPSDIRQQVFPIHRCSPQPWPS